MIMKPFVKLHYAQVRAVVIRPDSGRGWNVVVYLTAD